MREIFKKQIIIILALLAGLYSVTLFEINNESGDPVFIVDSEGVTIMRWVYPKGKEKALGDTLMLISAKSIKANLGEDSAKGLSRSFSVTSVSSRKAKTNLFELTGTDATMKTTAGNEYTDFSPENIFLGLDAGSSITTGVGNTFVGNYSGQSNTFGGFNVYLGNNAGQANISGNRNVLIGDAAGYSNTSGDNNVFVGQNAGFTNDSGVDNVIFGTNAGYSNTTGNNNVIIGKSAGYSYDGSFGNVFIGEEAAANLSSSQRSVMIGYSSGGDIDSLVYGNVFIGGVAGRKINGSYNVVIGEGAGENYNLGSNGWRNVFIGRECGRFSTGDENIYIGYGTGRGTFDDPHTGSRNIYLGSDAGWASRTESDRLRIGSLLWGNLSTEMLVVNGEDTDNLNSRKFFVNGSAGGTTAWNNDSDERDKKNIENIGNALEKVSKLRGVTYEWKDPEKHEPGKKMGFIAQESIDIIPEAVDYSEENDHYTMQYSTITALLVEAIKDLRGEFIEKFTSVADASEKMKEQDKRIDVLVKENEELKRKVSELQELRAEIEQIKTQLTGYASK